MNMIQKKMYNFVLSMLKYIRDILKKFKLFSVLYVKVNTNKINSKTNNKFPYGLRA